MLDKIINLISTEKNILLFGDLVIDKYIEISSSRLSSETIIPVMKQENEYSFLGCAGNVAKIINEFNSNVFLLSCIGRNNSIIYNICHDEKINIDYSLFLENYNQTKKRYINNNQQYFRVDNYDILNYEEYKSIIEKNFLNCLDQNKIDIIIISDYELGFCNDLNYIIKIARERNIKIVIDPHGFKLAKYKGCNIFKPNKKELHQLTGIKINNNLDLIKCAKKIKEELNTDLIISTLGSDGIFYYKDENDTNIITTNKISFIDVCGAGDTINSIISIGIISGLSYFDICKIANMYASVFIKKIGTSKIYFYEILELLKNPIELNLEKLIVFTNYLKKYKNLKIGITTGCFDIFHSGHLESLKYAKNNCDILILLLNSDISIKKLKGNKRPINCLKFRKNLIMQLEPIDIIAVFDDKEANNILDKLYFNVLFKGGDYNINKLKKQFPNIDIKISKHETNISTTIIENKIKNM